MANYKKGDRLQVKSNGNMATVSGVSYNSISGDNEIYIIWDNFPGIGEVGYNEDDIARDFDIVGFNYSHSDPSAYQLPIGSYGSPYGIYGVDSSDISYSKPKECQHKWVEVGFSHTKTVCYFCDKERD